MRIARRIAHDIARGANQASRQHQSQSRQPTQPSANGRAQPVRNPQAIADNLENNLQILKAQMETAIAKAPAKTESPSESEPATQLTVKNPNRPRNLEEIVGQQEITMRLRVGLLGSIRRQEKVPHVLIQGASGMGKTSLAELIAEMIGAEIVTTSGPMLRKSEDLVSLVVRMSGLTVLWIDEVQSASRAVQESLYGILEDGKIDILSGSGNNVVAQTHVLPNIVIVAATTKSGALEEPFRNRFGLRLTMTPYSDEELAIIVQRLWDRKGFTYAATEPLEVARRSKEVPREAIHIATNVLNFIAVQDHQTHIPEGTVENAMAVFGIDENGFTDLDIRLIEALTVGPFAGRAAGIDSLSSYLDVEAKTLANEVEPYLTRMGIIAKTKSGRQATALAYELVKES